jgi:hypothetical protein
MKILMVASANLDDKMNDILTHHGLNDRLFSYWYVKSHPQDFLRQVVDHGIFKRTGESNGKKASKGAQPRGRHVLIDDGKGGAGKGRIRPRAESLLLRRR